MPQFRPEASKTLPVLLALCALTLSAAIAPAQPVRIAVLTGDGDRAVGDATLAQLEVALTGVKDITLLERAEIKKILAEQNISAAGLSDPATAVKLGKLLSVEMFLFIDNTPKTKPAICRVQWVEARTGIALASDLAEEKQLAGEIPEVRGLLQAALAKWRVPAADRHYVGLLGVHNEEPSRALDGLAEALGMFLVADLGRLPTAIALDRDHLQWLTQEKALTEIEQQIKTSSVLIEGGLRRAAEQDRLELKLTLRPLSGGEARKLNLSLPQGDVAAARRQILAAVAQELKTQAPPENATDAAAEASLFLNRARFLSRIGYPADAVRALEAAYALNPTVETRLALARSLNATVLHANKFREASEAEQIRSLNTEIRRLSLMYEQYRMVYSLDDDLTPPKKAPGSVSQDAGLGLVFGENTGEVRRLEQEIADLQRQIFDHVVAYCEKNFEQRQTTYWQAIRGAGSHLGLYEKGHADLTIQGIRQVVTLLLAHGQPKDDRQWKSTWMGSISSICGSMQPYNPERKPDANDRAAFVKFFREMQGHADPKVRLMACGGLAVMDEDGIASARAAREILRTELTDPELQDQAAFLVLLCVPVVGAHDPAAVSPYCDPLLGPWMGKGGDGARLLVWSDVLKMWMAELDRSRRFVEADVVAERTLAALQELRVQRPDWNPAARIEMTKKMEVWRLDHAKDLQRAPALAEPWPSYTLKTLPFKDLPRRIRQAVVSGDRLYCVALDYPKENEGTLTVHRFPDGGEPLTMVRFDYPQRPPDSPPIRVMPGMVIAGDTVYVGTPSDGLIEVPLDKRAVRKITEADGLPANSVSALAWYGGNLYLGFGSSSKFTSAKNAFAVYDPKTGKSRILASSADRDAAGPVKISRLMPDEKRKCLWIGAPDYGLCRYDPKTGLTECKIKAGGRGIEWFSDIQPLPDKTDAILMWNATSGMASVNLDTLETSWLKGNPQYPTWGCKGAPLLGPAAREGYVPAFYTGEHLLTGNTYLTIHSQGGREAPNPTIWWPHSFTATREGIFMIANDTGMILQKKLPEAKP